MMPMKKELKDYMTIFVLAAFCVVIAPAGRAAAAIKPSGAGALVARLFGAGEKPRQERARRESAPAPSAPEFTVLLDPGHGGVSEKASKTTGDHWDIKAGRFLTNYNFGADHAGEQEHRIVLEICQKALAILKNANTDSGWSEFSKLLSEYGTMRPGEYRRIRFDADITRSDSYLDPKYSGEVNVNRHFRLFDSPETFGRKAPAGGKLFPGRMSRINARAPQLVVCVHVNSSSNPAARGCASVIIPGYSVFDFVRTVKSRLGIRAAVSYFWVLSWFYPENQIMDSLSDLVDDTDTYFTGKRPGGRQSIGKRWQMVDWRYSADDEYYDVMNFRNPDSYWRRERSAFESMRRDGGPLGYGGDNLYASEELLKFIRMGLWRDYMSRGARADAVSGPGVRQPNEYLGNHGRPFISDWALPQLVNGVTAYLELAYLENDCDRAILAAKKDVVARSMAVGIYSLLSGFEVKKIPVTREQLLASDGSLAALAGASAVKEAEKTSDEKRLPAFMADPKNARYLSAIRNKFGRQQATGGLAPVSQPATVYSTLPLELPLGGNIDFKKYSDYFKNVTKKR